MSAPGIDVREDRRRACSAAWVEVEDGWVRSLRAAGRSPATVRLYRNLGRGLKEWALKRGLQPADITTRLLTEWMSEKEWARRTRHCARATLRSMFQWAAVEGLVERDPSAGLTAVQRTPPAPHPAPDEVYAAALAEAGPRERLMLRLAAEAGLRRAEVAAVHARAIVRDPTGGYSIAVNGKGSKHRLVPIAGDLALELLDAASGGYVFPSTVGGPLTPGRVGELIGGLLGEHTMHSLRHRFATRAYAFSGDVLTVQQLLGHASPATTQLYVHIGADRKRRLIEGLAGA